MKNKFCGYYDLTPSEFKELWGTCIFVCDTNVLLDLYRYSPETTQTLLQVLSSIKERLWIPYQVAYEYHCKLFDVLKGQVKMCSDVMSELQSIQSKVLQKCKETRNHPYVGNEMFDKLSNFCQLFCEELEKEKGNVESLIYDNPTKEQLAELFNNKVGDKLPDNVLQDVYKEGERRYSAHIPPGYMDDKKRDGKYGDLVIWKEIILNSKNNEKDVIFITADIKEDWYNRYNGKTLGPRAELISEFKSETGHRFYAYPTSVFLEKAKDSLNQGHISQESIEEVAHILVEMDDSLDESRVLPLESVDDNCYSTYLESSIEEKQSCYM